MKTKLLALSVVFAVLGIVFQAQAATKDSASPSPIPMPTAPARPVPFNGKIFAVDKVARTFSTQNREKKIRIFEISASTKITKNNKPVPFEELKEGQEVRGSVMKKGGGRFDVLSVNVGPGVEPAKGVPSAVPAASPSGKKAKQSPTPS